MRPSRPTISPTVLPWSFEAPSGLKSWPMTGNWWRVERRLEPRDPAPMNPKIVTTTRRVGKMAVKPYQPRLTTWRLAESSPNFLTVAQATAAGGVRRCQRSMAASSFFMPRLYPAATGLLPGECFDGRGAERAEVIRVAARDQRVGPGRALHQLLVD